MDDAASAKKQSKTKKKEPQPKAPAAANRKRKSAAVIASSATTATTSLKGAAAAAKKPSKTKDRQPPLPQQPTATVPAAQRKKRKPAAVAGSSASATSATPGFVYVLTAHEREVDGGGWGRSQEDVTTQSAGAFSSLAVALSHAYDAMVSVSRSLGVFWDGDYDDVETTNNYAKLLKRGSLPPGTTEIVYRAALGGEGCTEVWVEVECLEVTAEPGSGPWNCSSGSSSS
jgi:hypothetical protein